ncbi:MAG: Darcynin 1 [Pseudomonadales bacterium]|nr:Darcynin 1 [Pseudomonadales bacterium]
MAAKYTFFVHMNATRHWLALSRAERSAISDKLAASIFSRYPSVKVRFFDVEAFSAACSDIAMYETDDIQDYYFLTEALRDSEIYTVPYFDIVGIFPAIEGGFETYEQSLQA